MINISTEQIYCQLDFFATHIGSWLASFIEITGIIRNFRQGCVLGFGLVILARIQTRFKILTTLDPCYVALELCSFMLL